MVSLRNPQRPYQVIGLRVPARTSCLRVSRRELGRARDREATRRRGTSRGQRRKAGNRLTHHVQLIDARNGYHLWSERRSLRSKTSCDSGLRSRACFRCAWSVADAAGGKRFLKPSYTNVEAYDFYLRRPEALPQMDATERGVCPADVRKSRLRLTLGLLPRGPDWLMPTSTSFGGKGTARYEKRSAPATTR